MLITRKTKVPLHWVFYAQMPFVMSIAAGFALGTPFLFMMKKFIDNPAAITFLLSIEVFVTSLGGPFANWLSDRVWTRFGRRKIFVVMANIPQALILFSMPFAPDLWTLVILRWSYGIVGDIGSPNQALTMEIVPAKQRGMGSGFFKFQQQLVNLFVFGLIIGRFDDIYFTGPFENLFAVSGEKLIFFACGTLFLSVAFFTWFGIHEVEPPDRKRIRDERRTGENMVKVFLRGFFKDIFHKSLLPLYLLLLAGTFANVGLGLLEPLLYTEQWGYSLQEMGTNVAIGVPIAIVISLFAGWIADKYSKMFAYTGAVIMVMLCRVGWTIFVYNKPDFRPELHEIILFGMLQSVFGMIAGAVAFPLILEYVERNRLGTAGAGMGLFGSTIKNGFTVFVGSYILIWSIWFLPQAGDRVDVVFRQERLEPAVRDRLAKAGVRMDNIHLEPVHRPGVAGDSSRHWSIRRSIEDAGDLHKRLKEISTDLSKARLKLQRPGLAPEKKTAVEADIARMEAEQKTIRARLDGSATEFETLLRKALADDLAPAGGEIISAQSKNGGSELVLEMEFVDPVDADITKRTLFEALTFKPVAKGRETVVSELTRVLETVDLARVAAPGSEDYRARLEITPIGKPANGARFVLLRDPDFVSIESALIAAGLPGGAAYDFASSLLPPVRGFSTPDSASYEISSVRADLDGPPPRLRFDLKFADGTPSLPPDALQARLGSLGEIASARVAGSFPLFHVELDLDARFARDSVKDASSPVLDARFAELLPAAPKVERDALVNIARRVTEIAASRPVFITAARPVVSSGPADRKYDYFFSMQYFMIVTDVIALLIIAFIVRLEKRGVITRAGALEDANR